ncbi:hypothetical protein [Silvibacterium acidisoli]|uniref:hypothetical protein n=1 Tax=Acidobacteriaceae bacterium ZG23-2 TaxID=2883246 RepID=UPI00406D4E13
MNLTINNLDGKGAIDYTSSIVASAKLLIERELNEPSLASFTLAPQTVSLAVPVRNARVVVASDNGTLLFTGYIATEPAMQLAGQGTEGPAWQWLINAISDEVLLNQQPLPRSLPAISQPLATLLTNLNTRLEGTGIAFPAPVAGQSSSQFFADAAQTWSQNAGTLTAAARSAYRVVNGALSIVPVGSVTHTLSETGGTLALSNLEASMVKALANDITVCGAEEPAAYVTEYFEGDGVTLLFNLTELPYAPSSSQTKPLTELFNEPTINTQIWAIKDSANRISITSAGLTCTGGDGIDGDTLLEAVNLVELGGSMVFEATGVQFGSLNQGVLNGIYNGAVKIINCTAGFSVTTSGSNTIVTALVDGVVAGSSFTTIAGHVYTLRLRTFCNEMQRVQQTYYSLDSTGPQTYGGNDLASGGNVILEVQDTTGGVAAAPVILYSGSLTSLPSVATLAPLNSSSLSCSIAGFAIEQQGPNWVVSTPPGSSPIVRRLGTTAQGADCEVERTGRLRFYSTTTPQAGEVIAVTYRTGHRSVARMANTASIASLGSGGQIPGTAAWIGSVTSPAPRSSADCENATLALLDFSTNRGAAWKGTYTAWNMQQTSDVWPGDVLAIDAASVSLNANLVVRTVEIQPVPGVPELLQYRIGFANDWADAISVKTSATVPATVWLPQQAETTSPLANLAAFTVTSLIGSAIAVSAGITAPSGGGFEVRRRDWAFAPGSGSDLVLRSPVANFSIPRGAVTERFYIRMYDASTPPNYSRFSAAIFTNIPLS